MVNLNFLKLFILLLILFFPTIYAQDMNFINFYIDETSKESNKVSYEILSNETFGEFKFSLELFINGVKIEDFSCEKIFEIDSSTIFKKITCPVSKSYDFGDYYFLAYLEDFEGNNEMLENRIFLYKEGLLDLNFNYSDEKTFININLKDLNFDNSKNLILDLFIPKEVIDKLTAENRDDLIISSKEYFILDEDPLIAWNIDQSDEEINLAINKKINVSEENNFKISISENADYRYLRYIVIFLIIVIIIMIFYPNFKKNKKR
jgi:hypothetical protein